MPTSRKPSNSDVLAAQELARRRESSGRKQSWAAQQVGVSTQQWGKYERGEDRIPVGRYIQAMAAFDALVGDETRGHLSDGMRIYTPGPERETAIRAQIRIARAALDSIEALWDEGTAGE